MAQVRFHPRYATVLDQVLAHAHAEGRVRVEVREGIDPTVVATQLRRYAAGRGTSLRCQVGPCVVEVRAVAAPTAGPGAGRRARGSTGRSA